MYGANVVIFEGILALANKDLLKVRVCFGFSHSLSYESPARGWGLESRMVLKEER